MELEMCFYIHSCPLFETKLKLTCAMLTQEREMASRASSNFNNQNHQVLWLSSQPQAFESERDDVGAML